MRAASWGARFPISDLYQSFIKKSITRKGYHTIMKLSGKTNILERLRNEADEIRQWIYENSSPDTPDAEFYRMANRYAILCTRIYIIDKQW